MHDTPRVSAWKSKQSHVNLHVHMTHKARVISVSCVGHVLQSSRHANQNSVIHMDIMQWIYQNYCKLKINGYLLHTT